MKKQTVEAKLNALFGLTKKAEEVKIRTTGKVVGVSEEEIQEFREVQGLLYFLQAPALFTHKQCKHCGDHFFVSRKYVGFCSYTCIKMELNKAGMRWDKGNDLESLVNDPEVYNGNEPLWIRQDTLKKLREMVLSLPPDLQPSVDKPSYESLTTPVPDTTTSSTTTSSTSYSSANTMTTSGASANSSRMKKPKRRVILAD